MSARIANDPQDLSQPGMLEAVQALRPARERAVLHGRLSGSDSPIQAESAIEEEAKWGLTHDAASGPIRGQSWK